VGLLALHDKVFKDLKTWGLLNEDLTFDGPPPYDYHLLLFRKSFFVQPERFLFENGSRFEHRIFGRHGVGMVGLFRTGLGFDAAVQRWWGARGNMEAVWSLQNSAGPQEATPEPHSE
jgi:hypothetical protein